MSCSTCGHVRISFYETLVGTAHCGDSKLNKQSADIGKQRISLILFPYIYVPQQRYSHYHHQQSTFATLLLLNLCLVLCNRLFDVCFARRINPFIVESLADLKVNVL